VTAPDSDTPERIRLVVLFGGRSAEHDVSCVSARHVLAAVDTGRYEVEPIGITRDGRWVLAEAARTALEGGADARRLRGRPYRRSARLARTDG
jgi:D-alanine-D-alanine ligase-like ATP-grasp enzyme